MRKAILVIFAMNLYAAGAAADSARNCSFMWWGKRVASVTTTTYPEFMNTCLEESYKVPAAWNNTSRPPAGMTGKCKDGAWTTETPREDACILNGGVDTWFQR